MLIRLYAIFILNLEYQEHPKPLHSRKKKRKSVYNAEVESVTLPCPAEKERRCDDCLPPTPRATPKRTSATGRGRGCKQYKPSHAFFSMTLFCRRRQQESQGNSALTAIRRALYGIILYTSQAENDPASSWRLPLRLRQV